MSHTSDRRTAIQAFGVALAAGAATFVPTRAGASPGLSDPLVPDGATALADLTKRISAAPRRRNFKTVPMILNDADQ